MSDYFEILLKPEAESRYAGYGLNENPFRVDESLATLDSGDDLERFRKIICALEIERLTGLIAGETYSETPRKLWLKEDETVAKRYNNVVTTGVFRGLVASPSPRVLPVYIPVPQVLDDFGGNVYSLLVDRLLPRYFKNAAYAFLYQELKRVSGGDPNAGPFDAVELLGEMDESAGLALDEILYGRAFALSEAEEYGMMPEEQETAEEKDETEETEETAEVASAATQPRNDGTTRSDDSDGKANSASLESPPSPPEETVDPRRAAILAFAARRLNDESFAFGNTLKLAVQTGLGDSFVKARLILQQANSPKDELLGLIRFIGRYYNGVVVFIDQLDPWVMFTDQEKIKFLSSVHEFDLISDGRAVLTFVSNTDVFNAFDSRYKKECEIVPLRVSWVGKNIEELAQDEAGRQAIINTFIEKAGGEGIGPFTPDGIAAIFSAAEGRIPAALDKCRDMIEAGSGQDYPPIDGAFIKRQA